MIRSYSPYCRKALDPRRKHTLMSSMVMITTTMSIMAMGTTIISTMMVGITTKNMGTTMMGIMITSREIQFSDLVLRRYRTLLLFLGIRGIPRNHLSFTDFFLLLVFFVLLVFLFPFV